MCDKIVLTPTQYENLIHQLTNNISDKMNTIKVENSMLYKCKKPRTIRTYSQRVCNWEGTLDEYIHHIKNKHPNSYFIIGYDQDKFKWKIPLIGDQTDLGIFKHEKGTFLYEMYFRGVSEDLHFSIFQINPQPNDTQLGCNVMFYKGEIIINAKNETTISTEDLLTPILKRKNVVKLEKEVLSTLQNQDRFIQWQVTIS